MSQDTGNDLQASDVPSEGRGDSEAHPRGLSMKPSELKAKINRIIAMAGDDEAAHAEEDALHHEIIVAFCPDWVIDEVERLDDADFARWCA